jgi:hypothetical protein
MYEYGPACAAQINIQNITCNSACTGGATILAPLPGPGVSYAWSNGSTSASISNMCAGTYTLSVTDSAGCQSVQTVLINQPDSIEIIASFTEPLCFGDTTGAVCLQTMGGTPPISNFVWSTGATGNCLQSIMGGNYTVTVTDSANCSQVFPVNLNQPSPIQITFSHLDASCSTCPNGVASITLGGGTPPYVYQWSNGSNLPIQNGLLPGTYSVCVTDSSNCIQCDSVVISFTSSIQTIDGKDIQLQVSPIPFANELNVKLLNKDIKILKIRMIDIIGREHINVELIDSAYSYRLSTTDLPSGTYIILVQTKYGTLSRLLLKN